MRKAKYLSLLGATLMIAGPMAIATSAAAGYGANANEERGNADVQGSWLCGNGVNKASISVGGTVTLRGVGVAIHADATGAGTGNFDDRVNADGIDLTFSKGVEVPKRNVSGNPYVFFQPLNQNGEKADLQPILLGRCRGNGNVGSGRGQGQAAAGLATLAQLGANSCGNKGTSISLNRQHNRGLKGIVILSQKNDPNAVRSQSSSEIDQVTVDFGVATFSKQSNNDWGLGGNPRIKTLFFKVNKGAAGNKVPSFDAATSTWSDEMGVTEVYSTDANGNKGWHDMGRCSEIGK